MTTRTNEEIEARICELTELIESSVKSATIDGTTTSFDLAAARRERRELKRQLGQKTKRPACRIRLG